MPEPKKPINVFQILLLPMAWRPLARELRKPGASQLQTRRLSIPSPSGPPGRAVKGIEGHGCCVRRAFAMVDREEGVAENLAAHDIQLAAILKRSDFPEI
ncbi:MAG: hypothetical protein ACT4O2_06730 [Beijerinckiaceae bacterium]